MATAQNKEPPAPPRAATSNHSHRKNRIAGDKEPRKLDPQAEEQIRLRPEAPEHFHGPIRPKLLVAALPRRGPHRSWGDAVTVFVLEEIMDAYNVREGSDPWWSGPLYAVNRKTLAARFDTTPDTISASLSWLVALDLIGRTHTTIVDRGQRGHDGHPAHDGVAQAG